MNLIYALQDADNPNSFSSRFRRARARRVVELTEAIPAERDVQHARLLDKQQFRFLFPDAEHMDERAAGLTKSLIAIRRRAAALG